MPRISDTKEIPSKTFKKKAYRPWNLMDENGTNVTNDEIKPLISKPISNQLKIKKQPNKNQTDIKKESILAYKVTNIKPAITPKESNDNQISNQIAPKISNQLVSQLVTNGAPVELTLDSVRRLYGHQRNILFYIVEHCSLRGQLTSGPITNESLRFLTKTDADTIKTAVQRLVKKGFITRIEGKRGKGGFATFSITESVRNAVKEEQRQLSISNQLLTSLVTSPPAYMVTNWSSTKEPISPSSGSSFNNLNNTTTTDSANLFEWENLDIDPLREFGFSKNHLMQIANDCRLSPTIVQDSIYAFSFDLQHNNKKDSLRTNPINYFMGILRSGKPYIPPSNYESPQDNAMRLYLESKKQSEQKRAAMEKEMLDLAFLDWEKQLSEVEKQDLLPEDIRYGRIQAAKTAYLRTYFSKEIWPEKRKEIF
jgi:predicted transcriptional regulator